MNCKITALAAATIFVLASGVKADDVKHQKKEAIEAQAKADKAQIKADKEAMKYDAASYRRYVKDTNKADKEWNKLEAEEREDYYKWLKKHKR